MSHAWNPVAGATRPRSFLARVRGTGMLAGLFMAFSSFAVAATESLQACSRMAAECRAAGQNAAQCQARVDACMSDNACDEVYMSCLELMEVEEGLDEQACQRKRAQCVASRTMKDVP